MTAPRGRQRGPYREAAPSPTASDPVDVAAAGGVHRLLGELEAEIMGILWQRGEATVRDVREALIAHRQLAYTTVMTVMARLARKELLRRRRSGKAHQYEVAQTEAELVRRASQRMVRSLIDDFGDVAMAAMVQEIERADPARLERLREQFRLEDRDQAGPRPAARDRRRRPRVT